MVAMSEKLKSFWRGQGIKLCPGASDEELHRFETRYAVRLPEDFRQYLASMNGFDQSEYWMTDDNFITFLCLDEIKPLNEYWSPVVGDAADFFVFADYSISAHVYAIRLRNAATDQNQIVVVYSELIEVARSFSDFIEQYLKRMDRVLFPPPQALDRTY
jgi:cell wall assembly regulator SMI1